MGLSLEPVLCLIRWATGADWSLYSGRAICLSLWLSPAEILVIDGLESVSQTPKGSPDPVADRDTEKHIILLFSFKRRKAPPCLVSELANGSGEWKAVKTTAHFPGPLGIVSPDGDPLFWC